MSNTYPDNYMNKLSIVLHSFLLNLMFLSRLSPKDGICLAHIPSLYSKTFWYSKARFSTCGVARQLLPSNDCIILKSCYRLYSPSLLNEHQLRHFQMCGV